ncbi:hypothetical protein PPACK8108_LOCUS12642 [Phakopsora pachyrhizi]|uniref:DUF4218 domain-containing protein n=1 Tax=Phakopsora pachyrhizi TaxID=170000 RepID=A0AAV0B273_PHAPC|nr:hypothetical protein PPACK8108_LOCUS12642 [Phakopsora pachyrhizi]
MLSRPDSPTRTESEKLEGSGVPFNLLDFRSDKTSDYTFFPYLKDGGWGDSWTPPSDGKIIFEKSTLSFINRLLPRIRIPTWIKRAIPVLGKASFGRLKADEWRNLFTIQLPLILPVYWADGGASVCSLFQNFAHLVSMVNLALKQTMNSEKVYKYRRHTLKYLESCLVLFPDTNLAPNHHMAVHLSDCLDKFGPSRSWWSFSMERLMGKVLQTSDNNRLGQLEVTFLKNFCRLGNLQSLMSEHEKFPPQLQPFISQTQAFSISVEKKTDLVQKGKQDFLDSSILKLLTDKIKDSFPAPKNQTWISSSEWCKKSKNKIKDFIPINSAIENLSTYSIENLIFSTFKRNPSNSVIKFKTYSRTSHGIIKKIFHHRRTLNDQNLTDTWMLVQTLAPENSRAENPFSKLDNFDMQVDLKVLESKEVVIHISEIHAHCAWLEYKPFAISPNIERKCIALVSLDR